MLTNRLSKEIVAARASLYVISTEIRSPPANTDVGLSLFTTDWPQKIGNCRYDGTADFCVT